MKQSEHIFNAMIEALFGPQSWISGVHPLRKSPCGLCGEYVTHRDFPAHATMHNREMPVVPPLTNEEIDGIFAAQKGQTQSEAYRLSH